MKQSSNKYIIALIILVPFIIVLGQSRIVKKIEFIGHQKTKNYILEREIQHPLNVPLNQALAEADRRRLENLGIFSIVSLQIFNHAENEVTLRYTLLETWRIFPMVTPIYHEQWGWSGGILLMISNLRGRNETLSIQGQYGGQNTLGIDFLNPWITGDHVSLQLSIGNNIYSHSFLPYDIKSYQFKIGLGKYFANNIKGKVGLNIVDKEYSNEMNKRLFRYVIPFINIMYDTRDLYSSPSKGIFTSNTFSSRVDLKGNRHNQLRWKQSTSYFKELIGGERNMVVATNLSSLILFSNNMDVWYDYLGGAYTIRGWQVPNEVLYSNGDQSYRFGMNWITASTEIRQTLIPKFATKFDNEFGLAVTGFADVGVINNDISNLFQQSPMIGVGVGVRIPWPMVQSVRLDYGWSFYKGKYVEQSLHFSFGEKY